MPDTTNHQPDRRKGRRAQRGAPRPLRLAHCNVGKGAANTAFLQLCWEANIDVAMVQEPWTNWGEKLLLNTHPGYKTYVPVDHWDDESNRPRVITYVRKSRKIQTKQSRPIPSRDIVWLTINGTTVVNIYRPPHNTFSRATTALLNFSPPQNCVVAGDFNAWHSLWDPGIKNNNGGDEIATWAATHRLSFIGEVGMPIHDKGRVLDLTFSNIPYATAEIRHDLHPGADHEAIQITIPAKGDQRPNQFRLIVPDDKLEGFAGLVAMGKADIPWPSTKPTAEELDGIATHITSLLTTALEGVGTPRRKGHAAP